MEELINKLKEEAGLNDEQALKTIETFKEFIMGKVPPMMHPMIENFLADNKDGDNDDPLGDMMKNFGG